MAKIPPVSRKHVEMALADVDRDGVPPRRKATGYVLLANRRTYPPKYVLALAVKHATSRELPSEEFSGGAQTNSVLTNLGFKIEPIRPQAGPPTIFRRGRSKGHRLVTVLLEAGSYAYNTKKRLSTMACVLDSVGEVGTNAVVLFPGGWFKAGRKRPANMMGWVEDQVVPLLAGHHGRLAVSFGLDGRRLEEGTLDQLALAATQDGVQAIGRKFYPAPGETTDLAQSWDVPEGGYGRIATLFGKRYFLAVCYDAFGIKRLTDVGPQVDAVLDHVHGFAPKGQGDSGDVLFARHGFAGAAQAWDVPVFGAATFFNRPVPHSWPSGVRWDGPKASTMTWTYAMNGLTPSEETTLTLDRDNSVRLRIFDPWAVPRKRKS